MNKTTFINLAKALVLSCAFSALTYLFFCMCEYEWINIFSDSRNGAAVRVAMVVVLYGSFLFSAIIVFLES